MISNQTILKINANTTKIYILTLDLFPELQTFQSNFHSCSVKLFISELNISHKHAPLIFFLNAVNGNSTPQVLRIKFPFPPNKTSTKFCWLHLQFLPALLLLSDPSFYHVLSGLLCAFTFLSFWCILAQQPVKLYLFQRKKILSTYLSIQINYIHQRPGA